MGGTFRVWEKGRGDGPASPPGSYATSGKLPQCPLLAMAVTGQAEVR